MACHFYSTALYTLYGPEKNYVQIINGLFDVVTIFHKFIPIYLFYFKIILSLFLRLIKLVFINNSFCTQCFPFVFLNYT